MEEQVLTPLAVTHLLQHTLRSLCIHENSQWVYAVFWRILPRNYPPPKWDSQGSAYDRSRGNRRNWILVWEDGFCNFAASTAGEVAGGGEGSGGGGGGGGGGSSSSSIYGNCEYQQYQGLQPELFFKMSHEIYNYGEGLIGKVAADHGHKWIHREPNHDHNQEINFLSTWQNSADQQPRTWEAQFQSGIKTIALIAVREGVVQLGAVHKVVEDLSYVVSLRKKFSYIESIPGVLLPHPSSAAYPFKPENNYNSLAPDHHHHQPPWHYQSNLSAPQPPELLYDQFNQPVPMRITPSMSSLEALLAKLPSVMPPPGSAAAAAYCEEQQTMYMSRPMELMGVEKIAKQEVDDDDDGNDLGGGGESSSSMSSYPHHHHHQHHPQHYSHYPDLKM